MQAGQPLFYAKAVVGDMLFVVALERLGGGDAGVVVIAHLPRGEVAVRARAVPVAAHRLGVKRGAVAVLLGCAIQQPARQPDLVRHLRRANRPNLKLPLRRHNLSVDAGYGQPGVKAVLQVVFHGLAPEDLVRADAAVVAALGRGKAVSGPAERVSAFHKGVFLLDAEPHLEVRVLFGGGGAAGARVRGIRRHVGQHHLAHNQLVVAAPDGVGIGAHRLENAVGVFALRLVGAGAVKAPKARLFAHGYDHCLGAHMRRSVARPGVAPVYPNVFRFVKFRHPFPPDIRDCAGANRQRALSPYIIQQSARLVHHKASLRKFRVVRVAWLAWLDCRASRPDLLGALPAYRAGDDHPRREKSRECHAADNCFHSFKPPNVECVHLLKPF